MAGAGEREVLRLTPPVAFWWVWLAFVALNIADYAIQGLPSARFGAVVAAILLFVTALAYTLALRPKVITDAAGITVVNPFRTQVIPWQLIESVDTGEWVRVRYAAGPDSAPDKTVHCWALYVSARARRKIARGPVPDRMSRRLRGLAAQPQGSAQTARLPDEARYLASLPVAKAMAIRLNSRAERERAKPDNPDNSNKRACATTAWDWTAIAAVVIPALILLAVSVA